MHHIETKIEEFELKYNYDASYLKDLLQTSPNGFQKLQDALPLTFHRQRLDLESFWVTKIVSVQSIDCGSCLNLNISKALEEGVPQCLINAILFDETKLCEAHQALRTYVNSIINNKVDDFAAKFIKRRYSRAQLLELGICIATAQIFPLIKKVAGYNNSCSLITI